MRKTVSVCIASYNGEKYITEQIESILPQLQETDEIIVSDDGSSDNTREIVRDLIRKDGRIKLIKGVSPRWNRRGRPKVSETVLEDLPFAGNKLFIRMRVRRAQVSFFYGNKPDTLTSIGAEYPMSAGGWVGARPGIFAFNPQGVWGGWGDFNYVKVSPLKSFN